MKNKSTVFGTVAGLTALMGVLPFLITLGIATHTDWDALALAITHFALMGVGAWLFSIWFRD